MLVVHPIDRIFEIELSYGKEKVNFFYKQLTYKIKSMITGITTDVKNGEVLTDSSMVVFMNIKYGLKNVKGLKGPDGKAYKLVFETNQKEALTDSCVDSLLATPLEDNLIYSARELSRAAFPDVILHPLTGLPLEGVEVVQTKLKKGTQIKK
jgi:hypothetical protein